MVVGRMGGGCGDVHRQKGGSLFKNPLHTPETIRTLSESPHVLLRRPERISLGWTTVDLEGVGWHISSQSLLAAICRRDELANAQGNERTGYFENLIGDR